MADRRCGNCAHYEPSQRQGRGRCVHPEVRRIWGDRLIKHKAHACLSLGQDYWEAEGQKLHMMLGKVLLDMEKITRTQMEAGLAVQEAEGFKRRIGEVWVALGYVTLEDIQQALQTQREILRIQRGA
ncbi:MAG: hypothetical protein JXA37_02665 [Chloroflexia bacterium]|nr:hypothetical protein [Chloroflexia bacterium]